MKFRHASPQRVANFRSDLVTLLGRLGHHPADDAHKSLGQIGTEIRQRFELLQSQQRPQRVAAHILLDPESDWSNTARQIRERLDQGESFEALAAELSIDLGSANAGGNLGTTSGETFPAAFEQALASLEPGQVSEPVETEAGIHLIRLLSVSESGLDYQDEASRLGLEIRREKARSVFARVQDRMQELAFATDNLEQLQEALSGQAELDIATTEPFSRNNGTGLAANAQLRTIAFSPVVLEDRLNSEMITLGENHVAVVHLRERIPSQVQPLDQVRGQIVSELRREKAAELLAQQGAELLEQARQGATVESLARSNGLEWQVMPNVTRANLDEIGRAVFAVGLQSGLPVIEGISLNNGDYLVVRINAASPGQVERLTQNQLDNFRAGMMQGRGDMEWAAYTDSLRANARVRLKIDVDLPW